MDEKIEVLRGSIEYFDKISANIEKEMNNVRAGGDLHPVADLLDGIMVLLEMLEKTKECHKIDAKQETIKSLMAELITALENQDKGLVADIVEYEFAPILDDWNDEIQKILENYE